MRKLTTLVVMSCAVAFPVSSFAETAGKTRIKVVQQPDTRPLPPLALGTSPGGFILQQDLFDRNNPNNLRSDWPAPPAQPGQF